MRKEKEILDLQCVLTDKEKLDYSLEMSETLEKRNQCDNQKKEFNKQIGADIAKYEARYNAIAHKITTGKEFRDVECRIIYDWDNKTKTWIRTDTGEIAKEDIIPDYELQEELKLNITIEKEEKEPMPAEFEDISKPKSAKKSPFKKRNWKK